MGNAERINCELAERIERNAPELLKSLPQWVMWKYQHIPGKPKPKKPPFQTTGRAAAANDPRTWCSYRQAKATLETESGYQGIGFMLDRGIVVIDLDNCLEKTEGGLRVTKTARRVFELAHSYTEISPSGKGLHIFLRGKMPEVNGQKQDGMKSDKGEMYEARRYITVTGERVGQAQEIREDQEAIDQIYELLKSPTRELPPQATPGEQETEPSLPACIAATSQVIRVNPKRTLPWFPCLFTGRTATRDRSSVFLSPLICTSSMKKPA
jgi:primase-polymerase (primpol)-like protein